MTRKTKLPALDRMSSTDRALYVRNNFNAIARDYDRFNDLITFGFHRFWKKSLVRALGAEGATVRALDLCSGTGDISLYLRAACGPGSRVVALDFSREMLQVLEARVQTAPARPEVSLEIVEGDATDLARFADGSFDTVSIGFGLRNVTDRGRCLREILRVLRPGGRVAVLDTGQVRWPVVRFFHGLFFKRIVPIIGGLLRGSPHEMFAYLPASAESYPDQDGIRSELEAAGFTAVRYRNFFLGSAVLHYATRP